MRLGIELSERMEGAERGDELRDSLGIAAGSIHGRLGRPDDRRQARARCAAHVRLSARARPRRGARDGGRRPRPARARGARTASSGSSSSTYFVGYQHEVGPWFHAFDALLLPSRNEGTPVSAIETLAAGRPVVASRVGGVPDVVADGIDGYLFPVGDVGAAAEQLARLAADPELRRRMGEQGRERALARYRVPRLVEDVDRLYRALLAAKGLPVAAGGRAPTVNE